jgi:hypothetical protein
MLGVFAVVLCLVLYQVYARFFSTVGIEPEPLATSQGNSRTLPNLNYQTGKPRFNTVDDWIFERTALIKNDPSSAPIYAGLHKAVSMPRPHCIATNRASEDRAICRCYSQQATRMNIDTEQCYNYVTQGYGFNYTLADYEENARDGASKAGFPAAAPFELDPQQPNRQSPPKRVLSPESGNGKEYTW